MEKSYTIGQVADKLGINIKTLYYYDREGLLSFVNRDEKGNRRFTVDDLEMVLTILHLKNAGVKLKEIKKFIDWRMAGDSTLTQRLAFIENQEKILKKNIENLQRSLQILEYKEWYYKTAVDAGTEQIHLISGTFRYNHEAAQKFITKIDKMSVMEKELFEIEKTNSNNSD